MSDRTQTPEPPEPERTPAVTLDPAPAAPVGGLALAQLGSVDAVLALQQSSGNQAVDRVLRGQADAGETMLPGALGAALAAARSAAKPAPRRRADTVVRQVADDVGPQLRNAAAGRLPPEARTAQSRQASFAVDAGAVTATATAGGGFGGFGGAGLFGPAGLEGGIASYGAPAGVTAGHRIAADAGAGGVGDDDAEEGSGHGLAGMTSVDSGAAGTDAGAPGDDEMDADVPADGAGADGDADADADGDADAGGGGDADSGGQFDPGGADELVRLRAHLQVGGRAVDYFAEENGGATGWAVPDRDSDAERAASAATREIWARKLREHSPGQPRIAQLPGPPSVDGATERRRQVVAFRDMSGAGAVVTAGPERNVATVAPAIDEKEAARARNDATRALLLAWTSRHGETREN